MIRVPSCAAETCPKFDAFTAGMENTMWLRTDSKKRKKAHDTRGDSYNAFNYSSYVSPSPTCFFNGSG
jgi:hypothetical protein